MNTVSIQLKTYHIHTMLLETLTFQFVASLFIRLKYIFSKMKTEYLVNLTEEGNSAVKFCIKLILGDGRLRVGMVKTETGKHNYQNKIIYLIT